MGLKVLVAAALTCCSSRSAIRKQPNMHRLWSTMQRRMGCASARTGSASRCTSTTRVTTQSLLVTPDGHAPYRVGLDPRSLSAPVVDRSRFQPTADGAYSVARRFRFRSHRQSAQAARLVFPTDAPWNVTAVAHHPPVAGDALDMIASSPAAACLSHAEIQIGSAAPIALTTKQLDARRVELRASLADLPPGPAQPTKTIRGPVAPSRPRRRWRFNRRRRTSIRNRRSRRSVTLSSTLPVPASSASAACS